MEMEYEKNIKPILDAFDKIREILRFEKIELPKIVVVGDQSSGKSSVLESITGVSLPRGENTVTKCPIILQMRSVNTPEEEYAQIRLEGDKNDSTPKINLKDLSEKISELQEQVIKSSNLGITDTPIYVYVRKVGAADVTLYDLPGITYKNENLISKIRDIITKYTAGKETLILLVIPANSDFTTSEAISLIKKNSDYKERTIAIITKIDLAANHEKNLFRKIMENELELKFNPIVVRNRTQEELENNEDFELIRSKENDLIDSTSDLDKLPDECKGTSKLIWRLVNIQREKLLSCKSDIRDKIIDKLTKLKNDKSKLPKPAESQFDKTERFKECLDTLIKSFSNLINGQDINVKETSINVGSRIREKFESFSSHFHKNNNRFFSDEFNKKVKEIVRESRGLKLPNFFDPSAFHSIISQEFDTVEPLIQRLLLEVKEYMRGVLSYLCNKAFVNYPFLNKAIQSELKHSINDQSEKVIALTTDLLDCEKEGEWTVNNYYMDIITKISTKIKEKKEGSYKSTSSSNIFSPVVEIDDLVIPEQELFTPSMMNFSTGDDQNAQSIQVACYAYWKVFEKRFIDTYQVIILSKLVYFYQKNLALMLEKKFSPSTSKENFLMENLEITKRRKDLDSSITNLEQALDEINNII